MAGVLNCFNCLIAGRYDVAFDVRIERFFDSLFLQHSAPDLDRVFIYVLKRAQVLLHHIAIVLIVLSPLLEELLRSVSGLLAYLHVLLQYRFEAVAFLWLGLFLP